MINNFTAAVETIRQFTVGKESEDSDIDSDSG